MLVSTASASFPSQTETNPAHWLAEVKPGYTETAYNVDESFKKRFGNVVLDTLEGLKQTYLGRLQAKQAKREIELQQTVNAIEVQQASIIGDANRKQILFLLGAGVIVYVIYSMAKG